MNLFRRPDWAPRVEPGIGILVVGASGGMGRALIGLLLEGPTCVIGAHRAGAQAPVAASTSNHQVLDLVRRLESDQDCQALIDEFVDRGGRLDALAVLLGGISRSAHWRDLSEAEWKRDIDLNLNLPFFLSRAAMTRMTSGGGRIVLVGTESAHHGGSPTSLAYGTAKLGLECLVQGLARDGAARGILINGIRPGFIRTGFHERWQAKSAADLARRVRMIPLGRAGEPEEAAALILYLFSGWSAFITGQMLAITGGDWI